MPRKPTGRPPGRPKGSGHIGPDQVKLEVRIPKDLHARIVQELTRLHGRIVEAQQAAFGPEAPLPPRPELSAWVRSALEHVLLCTQRQLPLDRLARTLEVVNRTESRLQQAMPRLLGADPVRTGPPQAAGQPPFSSGQEPCSQQDVVPTEIQPGDV